MLSIVKELADAAFILINNKTATEKAKQAEKKRLLAKAQELIQQASESPPEREKLEYNAEILMVTVWTLQGIPMKDWIAIQPSAEAQARAQAEKDARPKTITTSEKITSTTSKTAPFDFARLQQEIQERNDLMAESMRKARLAAMKPRKAATVETPAVSNTPEVKAPVELFRFRREDTLRALASGSIATPKTILERAMEKIPA